MLRWKTRFKKHRIGSVLRMQEWIVAVNACEIVHTVVALCIVLLLLGERLRTRWTSVLESILMVT